MTPILHDIIIMSALGPKAGLSMVSYLEHTFCRLLSERWIREVEFPAAGIRVILIILTTAENFIS
jgi:hypothetical protein